MFGGEGGGAKAMRQCLDFQRASEGLWINAGIQARDHKVGHSDRQQGDGKHTLQTLLTARETVLQPEGTGIIDPTLGGKSGP